MKHEADFAETGAFKVLSVKLTDVALADGTLNPDVQLMGDEGPDTKLAVTSTDYLVSDLLGCVMSNSLIHISGTYLGPTSDTYRPYPGSNVPKAGTPLSACRHLRHYFS